MAHGQGPAREPHDLRASAAARMERKLGGKKPGMPSSIPPTQSSLIPSLVKIYLLDNSSKTFLLTDTTTSGDVIKMILHKLEVQGIINILASSYGLYESINGTAISNLIPADESLLNVMKGWESNNYNNAKFVFMIRLYVPAVSGYTSRDIVASALGINSSEALTLDLYFQNAETTDQQLLYLQYIQCVYHIITGQYPTTAELALELGAYHFIYKFQPTQETTYSLGFLADRIVEFIPFSHLRGGNLEEWEERLLQKVEEIRILSRAYGPVWKPQRKYLEIVMTQLPSCYGSTFFRCSQVKFSPQSSLSSPVFSSRHNSHLSHLISMLPFIKMVRLFLFPFLSLLPRVCIRRCQSC